MKNKYALFLYLILNICVNANDNNIEVLGNKANINLVKAKNEFNIEDFRNIMMEVLPKIAKIKDQKIILFIGNTGAGKSTSINYLQEIPLEKVKMGMKRVIQVKGSISEEFSAKIGHTFTAQTLYPSTYWNKNLDLFFADCPGFFDNRGGHFEMITSLSNYLAVKQSKEISAFVVVIPQSAFMDDRGAGLTKVLGMINQFIPNYKDYPSKIIFAFTKVEQDLEKEEILAEIKEMRDQRHEQDIKGLLGHILANPENVVLINPLDNGESRKDFEHIVLGMPKDVVIKTEDLQFAANQNTIQSFREVIVEISSQGHTLLDSYFTKSDLISKNKFKVEQFENEKNLLLNAFEQAKADNLDAVKENFKELASNANAVIQKLQEENQRLESEVKTWNEEIIRSWDKKNEFFRRVEGKIVKKEVKQKKKKLFQKKQEIKESYSDVILRYEGIGEEISYSVYPPTKHEVGIWENGEQRYDRLGGNRIFEMIYKPIHPTRDTVSMDINIPHFQLPNVETVRRERENQIRAHKDLIQKNQQEIFQLSSKHQEYTAKNIEELKITFVLETLKQKQIDIIVPLDAQIIELHKLIPTLQIEREEVKAKCWQRQNDFDFVLQLAHLFEFNDDFITDFLEKWKKFKLE